MTKHDKNIIELCVGVMRQRLEKERRLKQRYNLQITLTRLIEMLEEPVTEIENTGEHFKTFDWLKV
jgi:hypothetical protein